jgi:hypothetical protein
MQGSEIELGGFKGRTNKLVDGCYSWWVGGSFALLEALGVSQGQWREPEHAQTDHGGGTWVEVDGKVVIARFSHPLILDPQIPFSIARHSRNTSSMLVSILQAV